MIYATIIPKGHSKHTQQSVHDRFWLTCTILVSFRHLTHFLKADQHSSFQKEALESLETNTLISRPFHNESVCGLSLLRVQTD